jgi:hypothetical protein
MTHVADVIEEQLRNLDEARKAKREADQRVSAPDPVPARPLLEGDRRREAAKAPSCWTSCGTELCETARLTAAIRTKCRG